MEHFHIAHCISYYKWMGSISAPPRALVLWINRHHHPSLIPLCPFPGETTGPNSPGKGTVSMETNPPILHLLRPHLMTLVSLIAELVKNLPAMQETQVWFLGREDPLEKERPPMKNSMDWIVHGGHKESDVTELSNFDFTYDLANSLSRKGASLQLRWHLPWNSLHQVTNAKPSQPLTAPGKISSFVGAILSMLHSVSRVLYPILTLKNSVRSKKKKK